MNNTNPKLNRVFPNRYESVGEVADRRNSRIIKLFESNGITPIRLIGNPEKPSIIYQERTCLSVFAHNFDLHFTDKPFGGNRTATVKLTAKIKANREELLKLIDNCEHRPIFKVKLGGTNLFLTGYNFMKPEKSKGRYPVFARHKPKVYFTEEKAKEVCSEMIDLEYETIVI